VILSSRLEAAAGEWAGGRLASAQARPTCLRKVLLS
jgi:hypothetical protein